jgi:type III restriction enzyme
VSISEKKFKLREKGIKFSAYFSSIKLQVSWEKVQVMIQLMVILLSGSMNFLKKRTKESQNGMNLLPEEPSQYRSAYFASIKEKRDGPDEYTDTSGSSKNDDDAYDLIMRDKARCWMKMKMYDSFLAIRLCVKVGITQMSFRFAPLREMGGTTERRQTIGRGLRLPVNQSGDRVPDRNIAQLTVVANESYRDFADSLQKEYTASGVSIGLVRQGEFAKIPIVDSNGSRKTHSALPAQRASGKSC